VENGMETAGGSQDLQKPLLLKSEGSSTNPKTGAAEHGRHHHQHHHHHHHLRSRRDAVLPNSGYAIFSTLVVALGPLSLGFAVNCDLVNMVELLYCQGFYANCVGYSRMAFLRMFGCITGTTTVNRRVSLLVF